MKSTDGDGIVVPKGCYNARVSGDCFREGKETHASDIRICTHNCGDGGEKNTRRGGGAKTVLTGMTGVTRVDV